MPESPPTPPHGGPFMVAEIGSILAGLFTAASASIAVHAAAARAGAAPAKVRSYVAPATDGLVTNEFAYWHGAERGARRSPAWEMTSGSLFSRHGIFWTGIPDSCPNRASPDARSGNCTDSNVFRLNTTRRFAGDVDVSLRLRQLGDIHDGACDAADTCWHGTHIWLRYRSQYDLYYASINRADGKVVIKRKVPCGNDNEGSYFVLGHYVAHDFRTAKWNRYRATIRTNRDGSVTISLYDDGFSRTRPIDEATDRGGRNPAWSPRCRTPGRYPSSFYPPIRGPGAVGLRGDFANFEFANFRVAAR